jgi:hypothetical protein
MTALSIGLATAEDRQTKQAELDAACEAARQAALAPKKAEIYQECIDKFKKSAEVCEQEADGYNGNRVGRTSLFYDLPECEAAFEYQKNN